MSDELLIERHDGIVHVTLNRPQARNAMTFPMYEGLARLATEANTDDEVKVIIITGAGEKAFAAGTDISQFSNFKTAEDALAYEEKIDRIMTALETCIKRLSHRQDAGQLPLHGQLRAPGRDDWADAGDGPHLYGAAAGR